MHDRLNKKETIRNLREFIQAIDDGIVAGKNGNYIEFKIGGKEFLTIWARKNLYSILVPDRDSGLSIVDLSQFGLYPQEREFNNDPGVGEQHFEIFNVDYDYDISKIFYAIDALYKDHIQTKDKNSEN